MDLISFCRAHGILIDAMPPYGVWRRYPTEDHPRKRNGAVKYMGEVAFIQNHATETAVTVWRSDERNTVDSEKYRRMNEEARRRHQQAQQRAAEKARFILSKVVPDEHPYLEAKGLKERGLVWYTEGRRLLIVPMRVGNQVVGCQIIDEEGNKRFLTGQRTAGAAFVINARGPNILCEGYATGLSIQAALRKLNRPYTVFVCFSAGNLQKIAEGLPAGLVVADNDISQTGQRVAIATGWPYWISPEPGEDANDYHRRAGLFSLSQSLAGAFPSPGRLQSGRNATSQR